MFWWHKTFMAAISSRIRGRSSPSCLLSMILIATWFIHSCNIQIDTLKKIYPWLIVTYIGLSNIVLKWYYQVNSSLQMTLTDIFLYLKHLSINISTVFVIKNSLLLIQYITDSLLSKPFAKWKANYTKRHQHYEKEYERQVSQIKMKVLKLF